jgi:hypothetical protein
MSIKIIVEIKDFINMKMGKLFENIEKNTLTIYGNMV